MSKDKDYVKSLGDLSPSKQAQAAAEKAAKDNAKNDKKK